MYLLYLTSYKSHRYFKHLEVDGFLVINKQLETLLTQLNG